MNLPVACKRCCWVDTLGAEGDVNRPARYWAQEGREIWFSPRYAEYPTKFASQEDANVVLPAAVMAKLAPGILRSVLPKLLYI